MATTCSSSLTSTPRCSWSSRGRRWCCSHGRWSRRRRSTCLWLWTRASASATASLPRFSHGNGQTPICDLWPRLHSTPPQTSLTPYQSHMHYRQTWLKAATEAFSCLSPNTVASVCAGKDRTLKPLPSIFISHHIHQLGQFNYLTTHIVWNRSSNFFPCNFPAKTSDSLDIQHAGREAVSAGCRDLGDVVTS